MGVVPPWAYSITSGGCWLIIQTSPTPSTQSPNGILNPVSVPTSLPPGYVNINTLFRMLSEAYNRSSLFASGNIHDLPRSTCVASAEACGIAPGAPIGGCDPPHPTSIAAATQTRNAERLTFNSDMIPLPRNCDLTVSSGRFPSETLDVRRAWLNV